MALVKSCMKKVIGVKRLTFVELQTLILEIEVILNNRPLCADYDDDIEDVLTPNHMVFGKRLELSNENENEIELSSNVEMFTKRQRVLKDALMHFWNRWRKEYITCLREIKCRKQSSGANMINVNDVVIVFDEKAPRHLWRLARVNKLIYDNDNEVRAAEVMLGKTRTLIKKPINRLYPIESNVKSEISEPSPVEDEHLTVNKVNEVDANIKIIDERNIEKVTINK